MDAVLAPPPLPSASVAVVPSTSVPVTGSSSSNGTSATVVPNGAAPGGGGGVAGAAPPAQTASVASHHVMLRDVIELIRLNLVGVPSGFTKAGSPILFLPDSLFPSSSIREADLHLLFKYYLSVVPRTEQTSGFALIVDRRKQDWTAVREVFQRVISLFPARIKEVYLLTRPEAENEDSKEMVGRLVSELLLDFDVFHMEDASELLHYVDSKCLPQELGGHLESDTETWLLLQEHVEGFSFNARRIARRLAQFVGLLNSEDVSYRSESLRDIATKNRSNYRRLRKELEDLTDHGLLMLKSLQRPDANVMQRLAVQVLCKQLDQAWTYFSRSWKMQDHVYVQYLELNTFQQRFRELANGFSEQERLARELPVSGVSVEEINAALDRVDSCAQTLTIEGGKAKELAKLGAELLTDHNFAADCVQPKCTELKAMCQRMELILGEKRRLLHKFLDLYESLDCVHKWASSASEHLERDLELHQSNGVQQQQQSEDLFSQIRQIDYLLSKSRELKIRSRPDFDNSFDEIKGVMSAQTLFAVDDALIQLEEVTLRVMQRREELRAKAIRADRKFSLSEHDPNESLKIRRENILAELLSTEAKYVSDLESVLVHYRDKLNGIANAQIIFGNLDELHDFHACILYPELERCGVNPAAVARAFTANAQEVKGLYSNYCQNMNASRKAIEDLGGEQNPSSLLRHCQQEAGHQLPLTSYLLKPMQRLTKYQLLLKDLTEASNVVCGKTDLEEALAELLSVVKVVNDSMHDVDIKGLPVQVKPLGALNAQDAFSVVTENGGNKSGSSGPSILPFSRSSRGKSQRRQVFLYDHAVVFAKPISATGESYTFKFSLGTSNLGMSSVVKGEEKKIELWIHGRSEVYVLDAKTKKAKDDFAAELRKVIIRQKEQRQRAFGGIGHTTNGGQVFYDTASSSTTDSDGRSRLVLNGQGHISEGGSSSSSAMRLSRSRSLESSRAQAPLRSRSLDCAGDRSSPELELSSGDGAEDQRHGHSRGGHYVVLADYLALTSREIDLSEDEVVELVKVGCAGWWYVRMASYPYAEGWAPSTYLEKLPG